MINNLDARGRMLAQIMFSELEKIATRFPIKNVDDLFQARKVVSDFAKDVAVEAKGTPAFKSKLKELQEMSQDLVEQERRLKADADAALSRYAASPRQFVASSDEPDIDEVRKLISEVNKNKTAPVTTAFFGGAIKGGAKVPPPPKKAPPPTPKIDIDPGARSKARMSGVDNFAKKVGYGTLTAGGLYGGAKMYQAKKERDQMAQFGGAY